MTVLIIGYPGSGKSKLAEQITAEISPPDRRIYLAAMIPFGEEGEARIERHRKMREGKGFVTVEAPFDAAKTLAEAAGSREELNGTDLQEYTVLVECLSNLAANEIFERRNSPESAVSAVTEDVSRLGELVNNLVIVSNHFEITEEFDDETARYACAMDRINEELTQKADKVIDLNGD